MARIFSDKNRIRLLYWFVFIVFSSSVPYLGLYFRMLFGRFGAPNAIEFVTLLLTIHPLLSIVSNPVAGYLADKFKIENRVLFFCALLVFLGAVLLLLPGLPVFQNADTAVVFILCIAGIIFSGLFNGPIFPIINTETLAHIHRNGEPEGSYGKYRVHASFAWILFTFIIGMTLHFSNNLIFIPVFMMTGYALTAVAARTGFQVKIKAVKIPWRLLLKDSAFFLFLIFCFIQSFSLYGSQFFLGIFFEDAQLDYILMGIAFAISAVPEIPIMLNARRITAWLGNGKMILIGTIILTIKLIALGAATTAHAPWLLVLLMITHGLGFGIQTLGTIDYIDSLAHPDLKALYFNIYTVVGANIPMALGLIFSGAIIKFFDSKIMIFASALVSAVSVVYFIIFVKPAKRVYSGLPPGSAGDSEK